MAAQKSEMEPPAATTKFLPQTSTKIRAVFFYVFQQWTAPAFSTVCHPKFASEKDLRAHPELSKKKSDFKNNVCCCVLHRLLLRFPQWTAPPKFASVKPPKLQS